MKMKMNIKMRIPQEDPNKFCNFNFLGLKRYENRKNIKKVSTPMTFDKSIDTLCKDTSSLNENCNFNLKKLKNRINPKATRKHSRKSQKNPSLNWETDKIHPMVRPGAPHNTSSYLIDNFIKHKTMSYLLDDFESVDDTRTPGGSMIGNLHDLIDFTNKNDCLSNTNFWENFENKSSTVFSTSELNSVECADDDSTDSSYQEKFSSFEISKEKFMPTTFSVDKADNQQTSKSIIQLNYTT